jgi:hypothetical protein
MNYLYSLTECIDNKYLHWYNALVNKALNRPKPEEYTEKHHVIPKSLGGSNGKANMVVLTSREHFIAHAFLTRCLRGESKAKMLFALHSLLYFKPPNIHFRYFPRCASIVGVARQKRAAAISKALKGRPNTWIKSTSELQKESLRKVNREREWTDAQRENLANKARARTGEKRSESAVKNMSDGAKNRYKEPHIWINDGSTRRQIKVSQLPDYPGWFRGQKLFAG